MVKINNLSKEIAKQLALYTEEVKEKVEEAKEEVSKNIVTELKQTSPQDTGDYAQGWARKKVGEDIVIHNKNNYHLTHLLEHGHAKADGGRVPGKAHIRPAEERAVQDYVDRVERAIKS